MVDAVNGGRQAESGQAESGQAEVAQSAAVDPMAPGKAGGAIWQYAYDGPRPEKSSPASDLEDIFWNNTGTVVHKWHHYFEVYEKHFAAYRGKPVRMLEIGVSKGGSLEMWRKYFGPDAIIYGIDINPDCARYDGIAGQVRIGSQTDRGFLWSVVEEMGGIDIVLDDGSHDSVHMRESLKVLYPKLADGGVYMLEDCHSCYKRRLSGGYSSESSFMFLVKELIDDMHHWYHGHGQRVKATRNYLKGLHVYDSIVVLDKALVEAPKHTRVGRIG